MPTPSETLARSITRSANGHAYATIRLLVDRHRVDDAFRAYGYFRWVDDRLDLGDLDRRQAQEFLARQHSLIAAAYRGESMEVAEPEEGMLQDLVAHDPKPGTGLALYIRHMMDVMAFDAGRRGRPISATELESYTRSLAVAVTEALHYFIGGETMAVQSPDRYMGATGAHIGHMLRDTQEDVARGYFNIPLEVLQQRGLSPEKTDSPGYRDWIRERVERAVRCLRLSRLYFAQVPSLRCRVAGLAYGIRFEHVLDTIQHQGYVLRPERPGGGKAGRTVATFLEAWATAWRPSRAISATRQLTEAAAADPPRAGRAR
jgi:phytoene/squalene synthetase